MQLKAGAPGGGAGADRENRDDPKDSGNPQIREPWTLLDVAGRGMPAAARLGPIAGLAIAVMWLVRRRWR